DDVERERAAPAELEDERRGRGPERDPGDVDPEPAGRRLAAVGERVQPDGERADQADQRERGGGDRETGRARKQHAPEDGAASIQKQISPGTSAWKKPLAAVLARNRSPVAPP